jgi:hypothetical protein
MNEPEIRVGEVITNLKSLESVSVMLGEPMVISA